MTLELIKYYVLINDLQYIYFQYVYKHYYAYGSLRRILGCTKQTNGSVKCISE